MESEGVCMREISIKEIGPVRIGQVESREAATGCTVILCGEDMKNGMKAGLDVRGGGPASRDSQILNPLMSAETIHAVVLGGGSAFGLGAANGVMKYLEEHDIGFDVGVTKVPLVVQSDIFDLTVGDVYTRPDGDMGYAAAKTAMEAPNYRDGNFGAGCGATVGKICGMDHCMKTGIGSYAVEVGELRIGAIVVLNALGDVYNPETGKQIAGLLTEDKKHLRSTTQYMTECRELSGNKFLEDPSAKDGVSGGDGGFVGNTTLAAVITNADFAKPQLCKIAGMAHDGFARAIRPVHTSADGDSIYALSVGTVKADMDLVGILAADVVSQAILRAVDNAEGAYGYPARRDLE